MIDIKLNEVEVTKLNLKEGDVLFVKIKGSDWDGEQINFFKKAFQSYFPNNRIAMSAMPEDYDVELSVITQTTEKESNEFNS